MPRLGPLLPVLLLAAPAFAGPAPAGTPRFDLSRDKVLYCVGYAHLDTQWRWDYQTTIDRFLKDTLEQNFERFEKHPGYVFNFTGSARYALMKEYYPAEYERMKGYIASGRWFVSGSSVDEGDVNVPSAEATLRQVLYGNGFFRREFGKESLDYMLPDCFGFPASMPSIWAHAGLRGFSTQKLTWGSAVGIPFKIGNWEGPDGRSVIAAFDPGSYASALKGRVDLNPEWIARVEANGEKYGVFADYHYYGVGDMGGAPKDEDVANYVASVDNPDSRIRVALTSSDQMYRDLTDAQAARLPRYRGDLLLTEHSAGTLTSQAYMKRWNRKNEILADAAERAAVVAAWLGGAPYPSEKLGRAWERLLANQMHDILPGTSLPRAYRYSWNDEILALNSFAAVAEDSAGVLASALDTRAAGVPLVVTNALAIHREDVVEATVIFDGPAPAAARVFGPSGEEIPSQVLARDGGAVRLLFLARVPPLGACTFDVRPAATPYGGATGLTVTDRVLESAEYRVTLNAGGDVVGIVDKRHGNREMLKGPVQLVFTHEKPRAWPAWNMDWADRQRAPVEVLGGPARIRIVESGPVRVTLEVVREARNSVVAQRISLAAGDSGRVEIRSAIDWQSAEVALRMAFPLTASNAKATYNWGMGTIERGNNDPTKYEVPSHEWLDLTDRSGEYGVTLLEDCKFGSDKPADDVIRMTLLYSPGVRKGYQDQHSQDWGRHEMLHAIAGHAGDWRAGLAEWQGRRLNQPLVAFQVAPHEGALGRSFSFGSASTPQVDIRALKKAEEGEHVIVRLQELWGRAATGVQVALGTGIAEAWEVDGQERRIGAATLRGGRLVLDMTPYSPRTFAVVLAPARARVAPLVATSVALPFDTDVMSRDGARKDGGMDAEGRTYPAEQLPARIVSEAVPFEMGPAGDGALNAVACRGQEIALPDGKGRRLHLLAAATEEVTARLRTGGRETEIAFAPWTGFVGQWDDRVWDREAQEIDFTADGKVTGFRPGFIRRTKVAWFATHRHHPERGNEAYQFSYLYRHAIDVPNGATSLVLPNDQRIRVLAATVVTSSHDGARPAQPLYDDFTGRGPLALRHVYPAPPVPVFSGLEGTADVAIDKAESFAALGMGAPASDDDASSARGIALRVHEAGGEQPPHPASGAVDGTLPRLNDGAVAQNDDDTSRCVWFDQEGRFSVDLGAAVRIDRINTYSWHVHERAPQYFSLWGSAAETMPDPGFRQGEPTTWTLIAVVDSRSLGMGGIQGSAVTGRGGPIGPYRHLLWVAEDVGNGTFFTEVDVHVAR